MPKPWHPRLGGVSGLFMAYEEIPGVHSLEQQDPPILLPLIHEI